MGSVDELWVVDAGTVEYEQARALQERTREARQAGAVPDVLLLLEHPPVYTRGRRSGPGELPLGADFYRDRGIAIVDTDRGGKVTYHGPGQLVGYPIMRTDSALRFVRTMEQALVAALAEEGVEARARPDEGADFLGVWVGERKIASLGVRVSRGVTTHGFALNVDNDLTPFAWIVPCGLDGVRMTSLAAETTDGGPVPGMMRCVRKRVSHRFAQAHGRRQRLMSRERLEAAIGDRAACAA
jgi:lipoyl(octanoyl) transferase